MGHKIFGYLWVFLVMVSLLATGVAIGFGLDSPPVQAATPAPPTVTTCQKVAEVTTKAGLLIEDFRCEDQDQGYVFYKNSLGFTWNRTD